MFDHFDLNNINSLYELYIISTLDIYNFLEYISMLIGVKPGYLGYTKLDKLFDLIFFIKDINVNDFIYIKEQELIVNKHHTLRILHKYNKTLDDLKKFPSFYQELNSKIIGKILGYPCPGIDYRYPGIGVSFYLKVSTLFKEIFKINDKYIQITGSKCMELTQETKNYIEKYKNNLDNYFTSINMGNVIIKFRQQ